MDIINRSDIYIGHVVRFNILCIQFMTKSNYNAKFTY